MALPPKPLAGMIEGAMGPGGPDMAPDQMLDVEIEVQGQPELPLGIEMVGEEQMEVEVEEYNHNANLAEVLDDSILGTLPGVATIPLSINLAFKFVTQRAALSPCTIFWTGLRNICIDFTFLDSPRPGNSI